MTCEPRILVVDDNADVADMTTYVLQAYGFSVKAAYGGPEGIEVAHSFRPTLIFLDIGMPEMDGFQVAQAIRADKVLRSVKLVALTAWGDDASRLKVRAAGFDLHLVKPADVNSLLEVARTSNVKNGESQP